VPEHAQPAARATGRGRLDHHAHEDSAAASHSLSGRVHRPHPPRWARPGRLFRVLGPGLVTGAADDDPSGIATASQMGAKFGYGQLWTVIFCLPLMTAVQEACARVGIVTGTGLAGNIKRHYHRRLLLIVVTIFVAANVINIGADIAAVSASVHLLVPWPSAVLAIAFTALVLASIHRSDAVIAGRGCRDDGRGSARGVCVVPAAMPRGQWA
jgi:natural resistance-associated macrophage protein